MAKHLSIIATQQPNVPEDGKFVSADVIDRLYIRKLLCLTKISNWHILKIIFKIFISVNASVKVAQKIRCFSNLAFEVFSLQLIIVID